MASGSGSARAAILAIRRRSSSGSDYNSAQGSYPSSPLSSPSHIQLMRMRAVSGEGSTLEVVSQAYGTERLLEEFSFADHSDSDNSSDSDDPGDSAEIPPKRTATLTSIPDPDKFVSFVERRLTRELQNRVEAAINEELLVSATFAGVDGGDESDSDADVGVCRSPLVNNFPDAREYLSPAALQAALKAMNESKDALSALQ
eukprot:TRINITY_DN40075_c0_g1_i1.p1 TRINITY_DN40075_c0_g1~~TRINITY_DN40075_c0_g1_i1.p1  ORF type:complete len:201 (-),score=36.71 TRINITY_DN40075_c0_g1_i1:212-814(-)